MEKVEAETLMAKRNAAQINDEKGDVGSKGLQKRALASRERERETVFIT